MAPRFLLRLSALESGVDMTSADHPETVLVRDLSYAFDGAVWHLKFSWLVSGRYLPEHRGPFHTFDEATRVAAQVPSGRTRSQDPLMRADTVAGPAEASTHVPTVS